MQVGEKLYYWRNKKNMSIYSLSKSSGVSESHIRNLENNLKQPTISTLQLLTDAMNLSLSEFFNEDANTTFLTNSEKKLLSLYRKLPQSKADILIEFYEKMCL